MNIIEHHGREDLAMLYLGETETGSVVEFVESLQPPIPREEKWVLIVSTLNGCPVRCLMCDAGGDYHGRLSEDEIFAQIDALVTARFPDRSVPVPKFKIQFARMGEPALNDAVLNVLRTLPKKYHAPGLMPCISSVLPAKRHSFFDELVTIKNELYSGGRFQLQFSLHTTDQQLRHELINYPLMDFHQAAEIGESFFSPGDRKIALNFAMAEGFPIDADVLLEFFDTDVFLVKLTPLNPTQNSQKNNLQTRINPHSGDGSGEIVVELKRVGYEVILSLGQPEEDRIGSNCGQYLNRYLRRREAIGA
ncbi:radical SAM protein [candidate division LCP-89 bacterium B3_LCP]|uniref:Radical SAM protein n=1 Tax=candidate division LCP-89 bacterium B3_LCP TaxID=2012998 RepID=A0A532UZC5_UNCL8|nr:MAG: radical SAM protein [candidate division LCP-89 bacterium B3_LCP]